MEKRPLNLAMHPHKRWHPPTEPQQHLNQPKRVATHFHVIEIAMGSVLLVIVSFLILVYN